MPQFLYMIIEGMYFIFGLLSIKITLNTWKDNKNRILIAISVYMIAVLMKSVIDMLFYLLDLNLDVEIIGYVTIGQIIGNILFVIQLEFIFFLKKLTKLYTLPFIIAFYLIAGRIQVNSALPFIIYAMLVGYGSAYLLIKDGKRKLNGQAVGMGLFFLLWALGQTVPIEVFFIFCRLFAMILLFLGTKGFYEKYIFPDLEEEKKIMGAWIAKFVIKD
ncbi:MAG: hypothetical protein ACFFA3_01160 [Promethearchaeota archaeon]